MDKQKFHRMMGGLNSLGSFVEQEVLKGQEVLAFAEVPPGDGLGADQVYIMTREKIIWVYANQSDGLMSYKVYLLRYLSEYEYGKIPARTPGQPAQKAILKIKFIGHSEIGIESTTDEPEAAAQRHITIVAGIDDLERQLRKLTDLTAASKSQYLPGIRK